jgi:hypothetical protein
MTIVQDNPAMTGWSRRGEVLGEPDHVFERRVRGRVDEVRADAERTAAAEKAAFDEVDRLRGEVAIGQADGRALLRAQKALAAAQEAAANADAAVRAIERWENTEREARDEAIRGRSREVYLEAQAARRAIEARTVEAIWNFVTVIDALDLEVDSLNQLYSARGRDHVMTSPVSDLRADLSRRAVHLERKGN